MLKVLKKVAALKKELESVTKTSNNPFFKSKYADLNSHLDVVEPLAEKNGLLIIQPCEITLTGKSIVTTRVYDVESGEFLESSMELVLKDNDMQKLGAAATYARRYTLSALFAMKAEDDDGNFASNKITVPKTQVSTPVAPKANTTTEAAKPIASFKRPTTPAATQPTSPEGDL